MTNKTKVVVAGVGLAAIAALVALLVSRQRQPAAPSATPTAPAAPERRPEPGGGEAPSSSGPRPSEVALEDDPVGPLLLEGQVLDADEQPVGGAAVHLSSVPPRTTTTEADGSFSFDKLVPRVYAVTARKGAQVGGPVQHPLRSASDPVIVRLAAGASLEVTVVAGGTGAPIAGASVALRGDAPLAASTDSAGVARLRGVSPGFAVISASAPGHAAGGTFVQVPGSAGAVVAARIELRRGAAVSGVVLGEGGRPVAGARVWATDTANPFGGTDREDQVVTDSKGHFSLPAVAAGTYRFEARHPKHARGRSEPRAVDGATPVTDVKIELARGARVAGRVVDQAGEPAPWATVTIGAGMKRSGLGGIDPRRATADQAGAFELEGLPREVLLAVATSDELSSAAVEVDLTATPDRGDLVLRLDVAGRIEGIVVDSAGRPIGEAEVVAWPDFLAGSIPDDLGLRGRMAETSDGDGKFAFRGLPDGRFRLVANRQRTSPFSQFDDTVKASTGDTGVRLVVKTPGRIRGKVQFDDGTSPAVFTVEIGWSAPLPVSGSRDGSFQMTEVSAGLRDLTVRGPDFAPTDVRGVQVPEAGERDVGIIKVARGRSVSGRVLGGAGEPIAGATVYLAEQIFGDGRSLSSSLGDAMGERMGLRKATSGADGRFTIAGIDAAKDMVLAAEHETHGRAPARTVPAGAQSVTIDLVLAGTGSLAGVIKAGGKPSAAQVLATQPGASKQNIMVSAGEDGAYQFERLAAGEYKIVAMIGGGLGGASGSRTAHVEIGKRAQVDIDVAVGDVTLVVAVKAKGAGSIDWSQVFLFSGAVSITTGKELNESFLTAGGGAKFALPTAGESRFTDVAPGAYSVCVLPLPGDPTDPTVGGRIQASVEKLKTYCLPYTVTPTPKEQAFTAEVPPAAPLE